MGYAKSKGERISLEKFKKVNFHVMYHFKKIKIPVCEVKNQHFTEKIQNFLESITEEKIKNLPLKSQNVIPVNDESQGNSNPF